MTYKIVTDSTTDLSDSYVAEHDIVMLGVTVTMDGVTYQTTGQGHLTSDFLLKKMSEGAKPVTSQVNVGQFLDAFKPIVSQGLEVVYIGFSSGLSGNFQSAKIAKEMILTETPSAKITIIDTLAAASGEGYLVREALKLRDEGKTVSDVVALLEGLVPRLRSWVMADDLFHLSRGGRVSKTAAAVGTLVNLKPIIDVDPEGKLRPAGKIRGKKKALTSVVSTVLAEIDSNYPKVMIGYSGDASVAEKLKNTLLASDLVKEVIVTPLGPTIVAHTGSGTIAVFYIAETKRN